ncbi:MAG: ABC transporter ATP-binding protein [Acidobacteria bacterium]|nr:ABC transporter ATP-binding protein [Acidobacteriota bacterium]
MATYKIRAKRLTAEAPRTLTIRGLLYPHKKQLWWGLLAIGGEAAADVLAPWPLKIVLDNVLRGKGTNSAVDHFLRSTLGSDAQTILGFACIAVLVIAVMDAVCSYADKYITTSVAQWVTHDLRRTLYTQVQRLSMAYHDQRQTGDLISRVTSDIDSVQSFIVSGLLGILVNVLTVVGMIVVMFIMNWQFTFIALAVMPVLAVIVFVYTKKAKLAGRDVRKHEGKMISVIEEVLGSIRVVKAFSREEYEIERLEGESLETVEAALKARALKAKLVPLVNIVTACGTAAVLYFGANLALRGELSAGRIVIFISYLAAMYKPIKELSKIMDSYTKAQVGYERIQEIVGNENEMRDVPDARTAPPLKGDIDFEKVYFGYEPGNLILEDINLHIDAGTTVAIVGPTGSGKSTIVNLIPRFYDPSRGFVKIDGMDVSKLKQKSLREQISFVLQDTVLFSGTIWDNISYGRPEATRQEIVKAAQDANAMEFIEKLPKKFDTVVGERGATLSGGQRQRIAIARAIIRQSPILILDEPSSGLDAASEQLVFEALDRLMEGKTAIVIAHRLATVRKAKNIFVVKDGRIVETGTHDELIQNEHGVYRQLHDIQFNTEETAASAE